MLSGIGLGLGLGLGPLGLGLELGLELGLALDEAGTEPLARAARALLPVAYRVRSAGVRSSGVRSLA